MVNKTNFERAMKAALDGPTVKKLKLERHEFNIKKVTRNGNRWSGQISHHLNWRDDDQVNYSFTVSAGKTSISLDKVDISIDASWMNNAGDVLVDIGIGYMTKSYAAWLASSAAQLARLFDDAEETLFQQNQRLLLDGSWQGEAKFMVANIAGRVALREAGAVHRSMPKSTRPGKVASPPVKAAHTVVKGSGQRP